MDFPTSIADITSRMSRPRRQVACADPVVRKPVIADRVVATMRKSHSMIAPKNPILNVTSDPRQTDGPEARVGRPCPHCNAPLRILEERDRTVFFVCDKCGTRGAFSPPTKQKQ